jgi:predicted naringenin-chalcone synthase
MSQQGLWDGYFREHYNDARLARKVWEHSGITTRRGVVDPTQEDISGWGTAARMQRFLAEAMPLGKEAVSAALADADLDPAEVGQLTVVSCTGYVTPAWTSCWPVTSACPRGCSACTSATWAATPRCPAWPPPPTSSPRRGRPAVMLCLELTSLHVQPSTESARSAEPTSGDLEQMVAHALFSDAAAAVVLRPGDPRRRGRPRGGRRGGPHRRLHRRPHDLGRHRPRASRWACRPQCPDVLARHARPVVEELLGRHGLAVGDVDGWAVHPGGRKIVDVVGEVLDLPQEHLAPSYDVLRDVGNCSSATVLLVLERLLETREIRPGGTSWPWRSAPA